MTHPIRYDVSDAHTGAVIGSFKSRRRATAFADKRDLAYGAVRYRVRPIWEA